MEEMFHTHRTWEDWVAVVLGLLIGASPWLAGGQISSLAIWNAVIVGAIVVMLATLELTALQRWQEACTAICGLWLIAAPFVFDYAYVDGLAFSQLANLHFLFGVVTILLASLELWQDWTLSAAELAQHGQ